MKLTRKELMRDYGISSASISMAIKRGSLIPSDNKKKEFDLSEPKNEAYFEKIKHKKQDQNAEEPTEQNNVSESDPDKEAAKAKLTEEERKELEEIEHEDLSNLSGKIQTYKQAEFYNKKLEALLKVEKIEQARLRKAQIQGDNLPKEAVEEIISRLIKNFVERFKNAADNIVNQYNAIKHVSNDEAVKMREELVKIVNSESSNASEGAKKEVKNLKREVAESRQRGEAQNMTRND